MAMANSFPIVLGGAASARSTPARPLFASCARAGFLSPADDHLDSNINLHAHVMHALVGGVG